MGYRLSYTIKENINRYYKSFRIVNDKKNKGDRRGGGGDEEAVIQKIKNTYIGHRFEKKMYTKLMEYIDASPNGNLFNTVCKDGILDAFYIWTIICSVTNSDEVMYC